MSEQAVGTFSDRARLARSYAVDYPHMAMAPVSQPRPESLAGDVVFNGEYVVVPFGGSGESGWAAWFFDSRALRDTFVRRYQHARQMANLNMVTRSPR